MAGNKQRFTYEINADIGQAKKAINDLQQSIEKLSKAQINTNYLDKGINNAVAAAKELEHHLNAALNQNTGKLNLNAFTSSLEQSNISAKDLMQTLLQGGSAGQQTFASLANAIAQSEVPLRRANKTLQDFATTLKNTVKWEISSTMVHGLESALSGAVSYAKNLNTSLTNIRIVTGQSVDDMARFAKEANVAAKALSTTTKSYADASLIYYQQGDSQELAAKKAAITIKAANSSFETSAKEMSEYLTSVWNSYQVGADELEHYVDIMANLGAKTATSLEEIATSMQKVAATANTVGVSMEQVSSIIATVSSVTRESAESIGTSYKTIFARIGDLKLGGVDEDGIGLGQVSSQLDAIGVKILDESGNLREMGDIIIDLGTKWQTMNQAQKTAVAQVVAGKRQYTQLMALFENWDMFQGNMNIAENSEGALQKMQDTYAESWEAASARVQASIEGIYNKILNDQAIITITNGIADLIGAVDTLIERLGGMSGMLSTLGGIGINVFSKQIAGGINKTVSNLKTYFSQFSGFGDFVSKGKNGQILNNEQINYQKSLADWDKAIDEVKSKQGEDSPEALALQNSKDLLDMKQQLINAEYSLSDAEKSRAQQLIAQQSAEQERLLSLRQERESLQKDLNTNANKLTSNIVSIERGQGVAASTTRESLKRLGLEQVITDYTKKSEQNAFANSLASYYDNRRDEYQSTKAQQAAVAEIKKQLTDRGIDAHIIDDVNDDLDKALKKVRQIQQQLGDEADSMADDFIDKMDGAGFAQKSRDQVSKMFSDITDTTGNLVDIEFNEKGTIGVLDNIKEKFNSLFGKDSKLMNSLGDKLTAAAGTIASMQGGFESGASLMAVWNDEAAGFGDHLAAASGILTNLASGLAAGGIWGLIATGITAAIGIYQQFEEEQKRKYQEEQTKNLEKTAKEAEKNDAELSNIQTLMKNYNSLKETYDATGQGQDALAASARALADAYGLVGANVLIAEGRFGDFEKMLAQHRGLNSVLSFYENAYEQQREEINDPNKNSKYQFAGSNLSDHIVETTFGSGQDYIQFLTNANNGYLPEEMDKTAWLQWQGATKNEQGIYQYDYSQFMDVPNLTNAVLDELNYTGWFNQWEKISKAGTKGKDGSFTFDASDLKVVKSALDTMYKDNDKDYTAQNTAFAGFLARMGIDPSDATKFFNPDKFDQRMAEYVDERGSDSFTISQTDFEAWKGSLIGEEGTKLIETNYKKQVETVLSDLNIEYKDYITGLFDEDGNLKYNQSADKEAFYTDAKTKFEEIQKTKEILQNQMNSIKDKDSPEYSILQSYYNYLNGISTTLKPLVEHKDISEGMKAMGEYQDSANRVKIINEEVIKLIGKSESSKDFGFASFVDSAEAIYNSISETQTSWSELSKYFENGEVIQGKEKELEQAKRDLANSFISDFTSLDDFLAIYKDLKAVFTDDNQFAQVKAFIEKEKITDARLVNDSLIQAIKQDFIEKQTFDDEKSNTNKALNFNREILDTKKSIENYQNFDKIASSYKDNLNYDEAFSLQQALIKEGNIAWETFVAMDSDARKAYLESRRDSLLQLSIEEQKTLAESARNRQKDIYNTDQITTAEDLFKADQFSLSSFEDKYKLKDGKWVKKEDETQEASQAMIDTYNTISSRVSSYQTAKTAEEEAEAAARAFELVAENEDRAITKINRMKNAISELPKDMEEFNKLVKQLGNIEPKKLVEMSDLDRAKLILSDLQKPTEAQFTTIDPKTQKEVFNAAGYAEAIQAYEEARQSAVNVILESANAAFAQIENRMSNMRKEAEKTKTIAETLSGAVQTGELTETQKLGMDANLLKAWNEAADAPARAAIAMQQWNKYANENAAAARDLITLYGQAQKGILNAVDIDISKLGDPQEGKQIFRNIIAQSDLMTDEIKEVWLKAWDNLAAKGVDLSNLNFMGIRAKLIEEIGEMGELTKEEMDTVTAAVKDNMAEMFQELHDQNIEQARSAADAWREAFDLINDAKLKLLSGESILEMIAGDPQAILTLAKQAKMSIQEILQGAISNTLDPTKIKDFNINEYVDAEMLASGMFEGFGESIYKDMLSLAPKGTSWDKEDGWTDAQGNKISERDILSPVYETMLKASKPQATQQQINKWLDQIFTDPSVYMDLLVNSMSQLESATSAAAQALQSLTDTRQIEAAGDIKNTEAEFRGKNVEYEDLTEVQAAIDRAQQAKYDGKTWESLSQEDRDLLDEYDIDFTNVDTAATECATALAQCAGAAVQLMEAMARDKGYSQNADGEWGQNTFTDADGNIYTHQDLVEKHGLMYDADELGLKNNGFQVSEGVTEAMKNANEAVEKANGAVSDTDYQTMERMASSVGMTVDEFEALKKSIEDADTSMTLAKKDMNEIARATAKASKGLEELKDSFDENAKTLKKADKHSNEYIKAMSKMRKQLSDIFDTDEEFITDEFVEKNLENMEKMANGTEEEAKVAAEAISDNLVKQIFEMEDIQDTTITVGADTNSAEITVSSFFTDFMDQYDNVEIGTHINTGPAIDGLNSILSAGQMTADQVTAALNAIGWEPEVTWEKKTGTVKEAQAAHGYIQTINGYKPISQEINSEATIDFYVPRIGSATKKGTGASSPSSGSSGGSGGGGGSNDSKETKDKVRGRDEIERYHKQNDTIDRLSSSLEKIDKLKDRAYGKDHLTQLDAETDALNKQLAAQQDLHDEALKWMAADKADLEQYGAKFDENGTITNYEKVMENIIDEYNAAIETYNNSDQGEGDKLALEAAEQKFNDAKEAIENYEEALSIANDTANEMLEIQNQLSELEVEKITYKLELKLDVNESELDIIDYYKNKYEDSLGDQDEYFSKLLEANTVYENNLEALEQARIELETKHSLGLINDADYAEQMEALQSQMLENLNNIEDLKDEINEAYGNTLAMARDSINEITDLIDGNISSIESYINILELSGRGQDYETLKEMYESLYQNNLAKVQINRQALDALLAEEQELLDKYKDGNQEMSDEDKERHRTLQQQIQETRDALNEATEQTLESLRSGFEIMIQSIGYELDQFMSGAATSLNHLQEQYDYYTETQGRYVSAAKELYEVSKLNRDIENSLATTTNSAAKEALKALQEKINKQSELNELTEYDIEMNQLQYQLLLARIKLEEAENAKDTVRLTRDENGNYAYRYTANQDKIDEAAQHYEDVLQQINDTTVQRTQEIEAQIVSTMQNYKEKLLEISMDYSLTEEERLQRIEELNVQFAETMQYLQEQNNIATNNLANNQSAIAEHYGVNVSTITSSTAGNVNASIQSMIANTEDYITAMNDAIYGENGILALWVEYQNRITDVNEESGTSYEELREEVQLMTESLDDFKNEAEEVIDTLEETLDSLMELTEAWDAHGTELDNIIDKYENIVEIIQRTRTAMNGFGGTGSSTNGSGGSNGRAYATGGLADYTGLAWLDGTPEKPELVLNPTDTENLITAVDTVRSLDSNILGTLVNSVKMGAAAMMNMFNNAYHAAGNVFSNNTTEATELMQDIHITAEFPSVTEKNEIEEALLSLANRATQFANRRK